ncbi:hypothetical protein HF086_013283, partial [Spodoptera exigua]
MTEKKQEMVVMNQDQFTTLINKLSEANGTTNNASKSFARCTKRYDGERNYCKVEEFITSISVYKKIEKICDEDALEGLTLLLSGAAATWWSGIKSDIKKWNQALDAIRSSFAPKMQPHEIYLAVYSKKQTRETIDEFVCEKRALLSQLPAKRHREDEHLDFVYGLLDIAYKKEIARTDIKTFSELLERGRHLESLKKEAGEITTTVSSNLEKKQIKRCSFCGKKGHLYDVCRKRLAEQKETAATEDKPPVITCYGCGAPGVFRSNCSTCKNKETPPKPVAFYTMQHILQTDAKIPTIKQMTDITLADGTIRPSNMLTTTIDTLIGDRTLPIKLSVIPEAVDNRTLLGIDFLEKSGIILNLGQRSWHFIDKPELTYGFIQLNNGSIPLKAMKCLTFEEPVEVKAASEFINWAQELNMLSPMPDTPSPYRNVEDSPP